MLDKPRENWKHCRQIRDERGGAPMSHLEHIKIIRQQLVDYITEQWAGGDAKYAAELVDDHLAVVEHKHAGKGRPGTFASSEVIRLMEEDWAARERLTKAHQRG